MAPITVVPPDITTVINQEFFIEPLGGPKNPVSYLEAFPESIWNKSIDSNLVALMYALLGPAGLGTLRQNYLEARLEIEENGLSTTNLDALYADPFSFARLAFETYEDNTEGLLTNEQWAKIQASDASYKNRAINYLKAIRAGGTLLGITLAATSGLNRAVEIIENYRFLYDQYSDDPLELEDMGLTRSTEEVIILPRQELPQSCQQILSIAGAPVSGGFKLVLPIGSSANTVTSELTYKTTAIEAQEILEKVYVIGSLNVEVSGGPLPVVPLTISFKGKLADTALPAFLIEENTLENSESQPVYPEIEIGQVGVSADGQIAIIPAEDWYYAQVAIGNIKPMTTIPTPGKAPGLTKRQPSSSVFSDSEFTEIIRYVTGRRGVAWPPVSSTDWIVAGEEREAPRSLNGQVAHYVNWHNISTARAYTLEGELPDEHVGPFSSAQKALYPFLASYTNPEQVFKATEGPALTPEVLTTRVGPVPLINGIYPIEYAQFAEVLSTPSGTTPMWSSIERQEGTDVLEIDLGEPQAVNAITFEASDKPFEVSISYDLLDNPPARGFVPVTYANPREANSVLSLGYNAQNPNPWTTIELSIQTSLNTIIYTRFLRLEFTRVIGEANPFVEKIQGNPSAIQIHPYSIEVRNLRVGRNLAP